MNTKRPSYLIVLLAMLFVISCKDNGDNTIISRNELPQSAITFLEEYFPDNKIIVANKYDYPTYTATLADGTQNILVSFDGKGEWQLITSPQGLPQTARKIIYDSLDSLVGVAEEFDSYYEGQKITRLYKDMNDDIQFVLDDKYISSIIHAHEGWAHADQYVDGRYEVPQKVMDFIKGDFRSTSKDIGPQPKLLRYKGFRGYIYRFVLLQGTNTYIDFYEDGEWFYIEDKASLIKNYIAHILPESIYTTLKDNFERAEGNINTVARYNNDTLYGVTYQNGLTYQNNKFALISKDNKIIEPPLDAAKAYIESGFNLTEELKYEVRLNTGGAYHLRHAFIATGKDIKISLVTDFEGGMRSISAGPVTSVQEKVIALPEAVLNTMPKAALDYVKEKYTSNNPIIQIGYNYSKSQDDISDKFYFTVSIPNNLVSIYFDAVTGEFIEEHKAIGGQ